MGRGSRAQTSIDFAIAMGIFLVALTTIVAFMPTMTQPFTGSQENPLMADRLAAQLVDGQLGDPANPSTLNATCTMVFFDDSRTGSPCESFDGGDNVTSKLGAGNTSFVNVTIQKNVTGEADPEKVCAQPPDAGDLKAHSSGCGGYVLMAEGPDPPNEAGSVTLARRVGVLNGEQVYVVVEVWT